jgi:hypothetical protein
MDKTQIENLFDEISKFKQENIRLQKLSDGQSSTIRDQRITIQTLESMMQKFVSLIIKGGRV